MYTVIAGDSLFAKELAKRLKEKKDNKVVMLIKDKEKAMEISAEEGIIVVTGSALDIKVLEDLKLDTCDVFISATSIEEVNILSALYAREANVKGIFVMTSNLETELILRRMDINAVNAEVYSASYIEHKISMPVTNGLLGLYTRTPRPFDVVEKEVKKGSALIGKKLCNIKNKVFSTIAMYKDEVYSISDEKVVEGCTLVILCETEKINDLDKALKELEKSFSRK